MIYEVPIIIRSNYELENAIYKLFDVKTILLGGLPFKGRLSSLEVTVITFIYLYGYSKEVISYISKVRGQRSEQSVRNVVSNLIRAGYLERRSKNNVIIKYDLINFQ